MCNVLKIIVCLLPFSLAIVLSVLLKFTDYDTQLVSNLPFLLRNIRIHGHSLSMLDTCQRLGQILQTHSNVIVQIDIV